MMTPQGKCISIFSQLTPYLQGPSKLSVKPTSQFTSFLPVEGMTSPFRRQIEHFLLSVAVDVQFVF